MVGTSVAAEGTGLRHNEDILIGDTPLAMAKQIMRLYEDPDLWLRLSANGYQTFLDEFSLAAGTPKVVGVVDELCATIRR